MLGKWSLAESPELEYSGCDLLTCLSRKSHHCDVEDDFQTCKWTTLCGMDSPAATIRLLLLYIDIEC